MKPLSVKLGVILSGLIILGYAEVCKGQCAWVLWQNNVVGEYTKTTGWLPEIGLPTYDACKKEKDLRIAKKVKFWQEMPGTEIIYVSNGGEVEGIQIKDKGKTAGYDYLKCLPDTVDPRK